MQINSNTKIEDIPLVRIRSLFRQAGLGGSLSVEFVCQELSLTNSKATRLLRALTVEGFLTADNKAWSLTKEGIRMRGATAAKPLHRQTADRLLGDLLQRIDLLNRDDHFLARVEKAVVFGSYLSNADRLGDVDVAIELARRESDYDRHLKSNYRRVADEERKGRRFSNMLDQICWWQQEAMLFLRNRKRGLSLQDYASIREVVESSPHRVVFPVPDR
jgi:hypothetical protein